MGTVLKLNTMIVESVLQVSRIAINIIYGAYKFPHCKHKLQNNTYLSFFVQLIVPGVLGRRGHHVQ